MSPRKIIVGFDFDGVIAYNPARLARFPISFVKQHILGIQKVSFFVPHTSLEKSLWSLAHESSVFPAQGVSLLRRLTKENKIEAHLVTGRFGFLEDHLLRFLNRWDLQSCFTSITLNKKNEQPHLFKERIVRQKRFAYFVEDNWDIVNHLVVKKVPAKIHWIYNVFDRNRVYKNKYPYVQKSLEQIIAV
ncbi:MAG: hypothetical protein AAB492_04425 [Patescibacteria group bacterium]